MTAADSLPTITTAVGRSAARPEPVLATLLPSERETERLWRFVAAIAQTEFVPKPLRGRPAAILAAVMTGREMGIAPMRALRQIAIVDGKPAPAAELQMALVLSKGHAIRVKTSTSQRCVVAGRRREWPDEWGWDEVEWTLDDAVRALLCALDDQGQPRARSKQRLPLPWESYPRAMLRARAISELCRMTFPDVIEGFSYAPEELGAQLDPDSGRPADLVAVAGDAGYDPLEGVPEPVRAQVAAELAAPADGSTPDDAVLVDERGTAITLHDDPADSADAGRPVGLTRGDFKRLRDAGIGDADRHALVGLVTGGRTGSSKDLTAAERALLRAVVAAITARRVVLVDGPGGQASLTDPDGAPVEVSQITKGQR